MAHRKRVTAAFSISPLATPVVFFAFDAVRGETLSEQIVTAFFLESFVACLAVSVLGVPAYLLYRSMRWTSVISFMVGGGANALLIAIFLLNIIAPVTPSVLAGVLSALVFRLL